MTMGLVLAVRVERVFGVGVADGPGTRIALPTVTGGTPRPFWVIGANCCRLIA